MQTIFMIQNSLIMIFKSQKNSMFEYVIDTMFLHEALSDYEISPETFIQLVQSLRGVL